MKSLYPNKAAVATATALAAVAPAFAQSSVTLYGIVDDSDRLSEQPDVARFDERWALKRQDGIGHLGGTALALRARRSGQRHEGNLPVGVGIQSEQRRAAIHERDVRPSSPGSV